MDRALYRTVANVFLLLIGWMAAGCFNFQPSSPVRIFAGGDVMPGRDIMALSGDQQQEVLGSLNTEISSGNLFVFNLESPLANNSTPAGSMDLTANPNFFGFFPDDIQISATLANNHSLDRGFNGLIQTETFLKADGIYAVLPFPEQLTLPVEDQTVKIFAINALDASSQDMEEFASGLEQQCDNEFCIASIHWGREYSVTPDSEQRLYAERLSDADVEFILGHHPHVLQAVEWIENGETRTLVAYSMGDLIFDITLPDARRTALLELEVKGEDILKVCARPLLIIPGSWKVVYPEQTERDKILARLGIDACAMDASADHNWEE